MKQNPTYAQPTSITQNARYRPPPTMPGRTPGARDLTFEEVRLP